MGDAATRATQVHTAASVTAIIAHTSCDKAGVVKDKLDNNVRGSRLDLVHVGVLYTKVDTNLDRDRMASRG